MQAEQVGQSREQRVPGAEVEGRIDVSDYDHKKLYEFVRNVVSSHGGVESINTSESGFVQIGVAVCAICRDTVVNREFQGRFIFYFFMPRSALHNLEIDPRLRAYQPWIIEY